jgi:hypothetical protein
LSERTGRSGEAEFKTAERDWLRSHLWTLAQGGVEPAPAAKRSHGKVAKKPPEEKPSSQAPAERLAFRSAGAKRERLGAA